MIHGIDIPSVASQATWSSKASSEAPLRCTDLPMVFWMENHREILWKGRRFLKNPMENPMTEMSMIFGISSNMAQNDEWLNHGIFPVRMCNHSLECLWFGWGYHDLGNLHVVDVGMFFDVQQWMTMDVCCGWKARRMKKWTKKDRARWVYLFST
jgi:hypothetical protein